MGTPQRLTTPDAVYNAEHRRKWRWTAEPGADTENREGGTRAKTVEQWTLVIALCRLRLDGEHAFSLTILTTVYTRPLSLLLTVFTDLLHISVISYVPNLIMILF